MGLILILQESEAEDDTIGFLENSVTRLFRVRINLLLLSTYIEKNHYVCKLRRKKNRAMIFQKDTLNTCFCTGLCRPILDQGFGYLGMNMTSATYTSAIMNVLPSVTFIIAWILR